MRKISDKEYSHERLGKRFRESLSDYDTERRMNVLIDEFFSGIDIHGKKAIDVGCGLGFFSRRLRERGAEVIACDLGESLVAEASAFAGCEGSQADCLTLSNEFGKEQFDIVVSSECIEHTPDPNEAVRQMIKVLKPDGMIALSTPNVLWSPVVRLATRFRLRPFDGLENFSRWDGLRSLFHENGVTVVQEKGLHLFPFQIPCHRFSTWCDDHLQIARRFMINICLLGRKHS